MFKKLPKIRQIPRDDRLMNSSKIHISSHEKTIVSIEAPSLYTSLSVRDEGLWMGWIGKRDSVPAGTVVTGTPARSIRTPRSVND
jgi:hypothetical protein